MAVPRERKLVRVLGAGPAGSSAALAALAEGSAVELVEKSHFPRHKVCGEFLSAPIDRALDRLGIWPDFAAAQPVPVTRLRLRIGRFERRCALPLPAYGLSRFAFDDIMLRAAVRRGAALARGAAGPPDVLAAGRPGIAGPGDRLFGFKAHFQGPPGDGVELFFSGRWYAGVSPVERGLTNVCGLAPESVLRSHGFEPDSLTATFEPLRERLRPLCRAMRWMTTGPLVYARPGRAAETGPLPAGDSLSFADPFSGSGVANAVITGFLAGRAAARGERPDRYLARCRESLDRPIRTSAFLRRIVFAGWGEKLAPLAPPKWLFLLTRPDLG